MVNTTYTGSSGLKINTRHMLQYKLCLPETTCLFSYMTITFFKGRVSWGLWGPGNVEQVFGTNYQTIFSDLVPKLLWCGLLASDYFFKCRFDKRCPINRGKYNLARLSIWNQTAISRWFKKGAYLLGEEVLQKFSPKEYFFAFFVPKQSLFRRNFFFPFA